RLARSSFSFSILRRPPTTTLFPYTTLFRSYPISKPDRVTGLATINWIAEITVDNSSGWTNGDWNKRVEVDEFIHHFEGWSYEWLDRKSTRLNSSHVKISYAVFCLKKKNITY